MWELETTAEYDRSRRRFEKNHPSELAQALDNLDTYHVALNAGAKPQQIKFGFVHIEPQGVLAIDQKGGGKNLKQTRLYIYPDVDTKTVHLIVIGDKNSQSRDLECCRAFIKHFRESK